MAYQALYRKYRLASFEDMVGLHGGGCSSFMVAGVLPSWWRVSFLHGGVCPSYLEAGVLPSWWRVSFLPGSSISSSPSWSELQ